MANRIEPLVHYLRKVARRPGEDRLTDGELLGRFIATRDETAFAALVSRHGPMVFSVCRRLTANDFDAHDAFQAVFLVLVRKAGSVSPREALGSWLYGVAYRTALAARAQNRRRRAKEQQVDVMPEVATRPEETSHELRECLDRELSTLPEKYRLPVVLCELEGRSRKEVARQLVLPEGTLSSRLAIARKLLAKRLVKYGPFSAAAVAAALSDGATAALPPTLVGSTVKCVLGGGSATAVALAAGVIKTMFLTKLKAVSWMVALVVTVAASASGVRVFTAQARAATGAETEPRTSRSVRNDLDVMRLEIQALRKDLKITKERVQLLEYQAGKQLSAREIANAESDKSGAVMVFNTRRFRIPVRIKSERRDELKCIHLYVSRDQGKSWQLSATILPDAVSFYYEAPSDGLYWFKVETVRMDGTAERRDVATRAPQLTVLVKTARDQTEATPGAAQQWRAWAQPFAAAEEALTNVRQHPADLQFLDALERAVGQLKGLNADKTLKKLRRQPGDRQSLDHLEQAIAQTKEMQLRLMAGETRWDGQLRKEIWVRPVANAEQALKRIRQQPNDKESLEALEQAVKDLKAAGAQER